MILAFDELANEAAKRLYKEIFSYSQQPSTGTLFLATDENRSGQVVFHQGALLGVSYAGEANHRAISLLAEQSSIRLSFTENLIFPLPETLLPEDSSEMLLLMGLAAEPEKAPQTEVLQAAVEPIAETRPKKQRIYRGQVVR